MRKKQQVEKNGWVVRNIRNGEYKEYKEYKV